MADPALLSTVVLDSGAVTAHLTSTGALKRFDVAGLSLLQYPASELEPGPAGLWLRRHHVNGSVDVQPLTGPRSGSHVTTDAAGATITGAAAGLAWTLRLTPAAADTAWFWPIRLVERIQGGVTDAVATQLLPTTLVVRGSCGCPD